MDKAKLRSLFSCLAGVLALAASLLATAGAQAAPRTTYYHWDAVGSPVAATDDTGAVVWREEYHPYGERINNAPEASANTRWYAGHAADPGTGLICMGARWYDPAVGRFMSVDPVAFTEGNPQTFNRYAYANNNPYRYIDPTGGSVWAVNDWIDFGKNVGGLLVTEIVYTAAVILNDEGVQQLSLADMSTQWQAAAISTAALASPIPGTGRAASWGMAATRGGGETLSRLGTTQETASRLARKAAEAEGQIGIHGVSTTAGVPKGPASRAGRGHVEEAFKVHDTPTRNDPLHRTVELPKPVTSEIADLFNRLFGR